MDSAVETLNPTRVRLTVEVPFEELQPSLDQAYKRIGATVQVPGFRKGKVPPRLIDQRFGRGVVLEEAVNEALPGFYSQALRANEVQPVGQPEVDVTEFADGAPLKFTAEVDVRPEIELPDYRGLEVTVDDVTVTDEEVEEQLTTLRERFGVLKGVERPAEEGDFLSIDLAAVVEGEEVDSVSGLSYEVGQNNLIDGLDEAVRGMSAGEAKTFTADLVGGEHAGKSAEVSVSVKSVKERELPELDDDFATTASEFDTLEELRDDVRRRVERMKRLEQGSQARDRVLETLLERVDVPLPESVVKAEIEGRQHQLQHQLENAGMSKADYLATEDRSEEEFDAEVESSARQSIKAQFVLDAVASKEELQVSEAELTEHLVRRAQRSGMSPEDFANQIVSSGQVPLLVSEVVRGKALALVLEAARVVDASGNEVNLAELREDATASAGAAASTVVEQGEEGEQGESQDAEQGAGQDGEQAEATSEDVPEAGQQDEQPVGQADEG